MNEEQVRYRGAGGPGELAEVVVERRHDLENEQLRSWLTGGISDDRLRELIRIVYEVSFKKDEGRYPRFTLVVPSHRETRLLETASVRLEPPPAVNARTLRRLAAAIPPRPHALLVKDRDTGLVCTGIGRFETPGAFLPEDQTGLYLRAEGLVIEVGGPGDLTVHEAQEVHTLKAGQIAPEFDGTRALEYLQAFEPARDRLLDRHLEGSAGGSGEKVTAVIHDLWMYVLASTTALAHGGAFAVLPTEAGTAVDLEETWREQIGVTYPASGPDLLAFLGPYVQYRWGKSGQTRLDVLQSLWDAAVSVSRLSATDGFVVLNANLRVLGFGARIGWDERLPPDCPEVDSRLGPTEGRFDLARAGLRHAAAYRICRAIPRTLVFIVSQDAELRIFFTGRDGQVTVTAPLTPVAYLFQGL